MSPSGGGAVDDGRQQQQRVYGFIDGSRILVCMFMFAFLLVNPISFLMPGSSSSSYASSSSSPGARTLLMNGKLNLLNLIVTLSFLIVIFFQLSVNSKIFSL